MFHSNHKCINLKWIIFIIKYTKLQFLGLQQKVFYCSIAFYCLEIKKKEKKALLHFLLYVNTINKNDDKGDRWSLYIRIWIDIIQYKNVRKKGKKTMLGLHAAALRRVPSTFIQVKVERNDRQ